MTPRGERTLDHRLLLALDEDPEATLAATVWDGERVTWAGFDRPGALWERLRPGEAALAGRIQAAGDDEHAPPLRIESALLDPGDAVVGVVDHVPDVTHPDLRGRVRAVHLMAEGRTWVPTEPPPTPGPTHHGTCAVGAALAAGADTCEVWCPATWKEAAGWELHPGHVALALQRAAESPAGVCRPDVVLLALERHGDPPAGPLAAAIRLLQAHGAVVVAAAGNHPGRHAAWDVADANVRWTPARRDTLVVWCFGEQLPTVAGELVRPRTGRPGDLQRSGARVTSLLGASPRVLSVTSAEPVELELPGRCRVLPPFPDTGELHVAGWRRGRGSVGSPARLSGVLAVGVEGFGATGLDEADREVALLLGPGRLHAPASGGGHRTFSGTSAAAAHVAGLCARLLLDGHRDPWRELSRMLQA